MVTDFAIAEVERLFHPEGIISNKYFPGKKNKLKTSQIQMESEIFDD